MSTHEPGSAALRAKGRERGPTVTETRRRYAELSTLSGGEMKGVLEAAKAAAVKEGVQPYWLVPQATAVAAGPAGSTGQRRGRQKKLIE